LSIETCPSVVHPSGQGYRNRLPTISSS
jgi:hypothetical protein